MKKKKKKKETGKDSMVCRDGWWLVWLVITISSFWHEYVCKDTNVHCGRWEHFKIEKLKKKDVDHINISWNLFFLRSFTGVWVGLAQWHLFRCCTHTPITELQTDFHGPTKHDSHWTRAASSICLRLFGFGRQWLSTQHKPSVGSTCTLAAWQVLLSTVVVFYKPYARTNSYIITHGNILLTGWHNRMNHHHWPNRTNKGNGEYSHTWF